MRAAVLALLSLGACRGPDYMELSPSYTKLSPGDSHYQDDRSPRSWTEDPGDGHAVGAAVTFGWHLGKPEGRHSWDDQDEPTAPVEPAAAIPPSQRTKQPYPVLDPATGTTGGLEEILSYLAEALVLAMGGKAAWSRRKGMGKWVKEKLRRGEGKESV